MEKARYAKDLLATLPELQFDPIANTIKSSKGGKTLILVNGIEVSDNQLRSITPQSVAKVDYYDIPPTRWANRADIVVNIITKNPENGYNFGADVSSALATGFVNGSAYGSFTRGKHNFGAEYSINYRNYDNRIMATSYAYQIGADSYTSNEEQKDHFGYTSQDIALRYTNSEAGKYAFQTKLSLEIFDNFNNGKGENIFGKNTAKTLHQTIHDSNSQYLNPTLDIYYSKHLGKKGELIFNLIGSYYKTNSQRFDHEWNTSTLADVFKNKMNLEVQQNDLVEEIAYAHQFEKGKLNSGYRISNKHIQNDLVNLEGKNNYSTNYLEQYFYSEYSGKVGKLNYQFGAGLTNIYNKSETNAENRWALRSRLVLKYSVQKHSFRLFSEYKPNSPWAEALSSNVVQVVPNIVKRGNPHLKSASYFNNNFIYSFNNKYFDFNAAVFFNYVDNYIAQYYSQDRNTSGYALTYQNARHFSEFGGQFSGSIKPFGNNLLVLRTVLVPTSRKIKVENQTFRNNYIYNDFLISSQYKNFNIQYGFNIPVYSLNGYFLNTQENKSHLFIRYKHQNWSFSTGMYWIGMPADYKTKSIEGLVDYTRRSTIYNNKNMLVLGISYDFSSGKSLNIQKKLHNSKGGAVTF